MSESIIISEAVQRQFSARTTLAGLGMQFQKLHLAKILDTYLKIPQKTVKDTPVQKLTDGLINLLAGAQGWVEINKRVRPDSAVYRAFGRERCAEQSVVQETLDACTAENVVQMQLASLVIFRQCSQAYHHNFAEDYLILDIDLTGRPCGPKAALATRGYFEGQRDRRGRQVGYVTASAYHEIVCEQVYPGRIHLTQTLQELILRAEEILELNEVKRQRTIVRIDAGGGSMEDINWLLERGYQVVAKEYAPDRVKAAMASVKEWFDDPTQSGRQLGWAGDDQRYLGPMCRVAVRTRRKNGQWGTGVAVSSLPPEVVLLKSGKSAEQSKDLQAVMVALVELYDQRGGAVEIEIKGDKQGLGTSHRNKKRFFGQQVVCLLESLAHNLLIWVRNWMAPKCPKIARFGIRRFIRDVLHLNGLVETGPGGIQRIILDQKDPLAAEVQAGLTALLAKQQIAIILGEI